MRDCSVLDIQETLCQLRPVERNGDFGERNEVAVGPSSQYLVNSIIRAARVVERFQDHESLTLAELSARLDMPKPTVFRTVLTLQHVGLLERRDNGAYVLGPMFISSARLVLRRGIAAAARPHIEALFHSTGHCVNLATLNGGDALYIDSIDSGEGLRMVSVVGAREPLHATAVGKAMLAELSDDEVRALIDAGPLRALTPRTITSPAALFAELETVRGRGYAVDDGECAVGARCVGAAVRDIHKIVGGVSVSAYAENLPYEEVEPISEAVKETAARISEQIGIQPTHAGTGG